MMSLISLSKSFILLHSFLADHIKSDFENVREIGSDERYQERAQFKKMMDECKLV